MGDDGAALPLHDAIGVGHRPAAVVAPCVGLPCRTEWHRDTALAQAYAQNGDDVVMTRPVGVATDCALTQFVPTSAVTLK